MHRQITSAPHGHVLTNAGVWSRDGRWIVYDTRSDPAGARFDGTRIEKVHVETGEVVVLYESQRGAGCGVATYGPVNDRVVFIHGPEHPSEDWSYNAWHRDGVIVDAVKLGRAAHLDARDIVPPFTPGALRGGSHVHVFSGDGQWVSFTYEDHVLATLRPPISPEKGRGKDDPAATSASSHGQLQPPDLNQRNIGVSVPLPVQVRHAHPRNHDGTHFSVLVTKTVNQPAPGSDEIQRAFEEAWVGSNGYVKPDGARQHRAIAFQGEVVTADGQAISEVFVVDIPDDITQPGDGPLQGTSTRRPSPPRGTVQRRVTFTAGRKHSGIQGPRHWLGSSPDGARIAFLLRDDAGVAQLCTVSPNGGAITRVTRGSLPVQSAFTWSPDGRSIACVMDNRVCIVDVASGEVMSPTERTRSERPRPEACVFSPDGRSIAFVGQVDGWNQVFVCDSGGSGRG